MDGTSISVRTLRQDYVSIRLVSGCSILRQVLVLAAIWDLHAGDQEPPETANSITECDCVRGYAAF